MYDIVLTFSSILAPSGRYWFAVAMTVLIVLLLFSIRIIIEQWKRIKIIRDHQDAEINQMLRKIALKQQVRDRDMTRLIEQQEVIMNEHVRGEGVDKRVLVVCVESNDKKLAADLVSIRQSWGVGEYIRVMPLTRDRFKNAVMRQRSNTRRGSDRKVRYIHMAVHSGADGILFDDGPVDAEFLSRYIQDIEILFINGCNSDLQGEYLTGLADCVVTLSEEIEYTDAADFAREFWSHVRDGKDGEGAFYAALDSIPRHVAEFATLL